MSGRLDSGSDPPFLGGADPDMMLIARLIQIGGNIPPRIASSTGCG
jgi:hypothetical protein